MSQTFPNRSFKIVDDNTLVKTGPRTGELVYPGGKRMIVSMVTERSLGAPKPYDEALLPEGWTLGFYRGKIQAIPPADTGWEDAAKLTKKQREQLRGSTKQPGTTNLGVWGRKNMHGWTKQSDSSQQKIFQSISKPNESQQGTGLITIVAILLIPSLDRYQVTYYHPEHIESTPGQLLAPDNTGSRTDGKTNKDSCFYFVADAKLAADTFGETQI